MVSGLSAGIEHRAQEPVEGRVSLGERGAGVVMAGGLIQGGTEGWLLVQIVDIKGVEASNLDDACRNGSICATSTWTHPQVVDKPSNIRVVSATLGYRSVRR